MRVNSKIKFTHLNDKYCCSAHELCTLPITGTKMQCELASPHVMEYATMASALPGQHYDSIEPRFRGSLTFSGAIVITSMQGIHRRLHSGNRGSLLLSRGAIDGPFKPRETLTITRSFLIIRYIKTRHTSVLVAIMPHNRPLLVVHRLCRLATLNDRVLIIRHSFLQSAIIVTLTCGPTFFY